MSDYHYPSDSQTLAANGQLAGELEQYDGHWSRRRQAYGAPDWDGKVTIEYDKAQHVLNAILDQIDESQKGIEELHKLVDTWAAMLETAREETE
jgi:hypothetical protein